MSSINFSELTVGETINDVTVGVVSCVPGVTKTDKPYLRLVLSDGESKLNAVWWDRALDIQPAALRFDGKVDEYQGQPQINITWGDPIASDDLGDSDREKLGLPPSLRQIRNLYRSAIDCLGKEHLRLLVGVLDCFGGDLDSNDEHPFFTSPAAKSYHHNFPGGLAFHTATMLEHAIALQNSVAYHGKVDWGLVKLAIALHDIGKISCYESAGAGYNVTPQNQLVGHISLVDNAICKVHGQLNSPIDLDHLRHCVLAHHGKLDWGSPVEPCTPEAWLVHLIDMIDSKLTPII